MIPAVLDTDVGQPERGELDARVLVGDAGFEGLHRASRGDGLGAYEIAYLEFECDILGFRVGEVERGTGFLCAGVSGVPGEGEGKGRKEGD